VPDGDPKAETHAPPGEGRPAAPPAALTLRDVQALIDSWMRSQGWEYWHPLSQLARMTEELGEVARLVNHLYGEKPKKPDEPAQDLGMELADLLYTMICLANAQGVDLQVALERVLEKYRGRDAERYPRMPGAIDERGPRAV
jgi:NTP pyrophosphatase (non-canonical NTP hydrolase)